MTNFYLTILSIQIIHSIKYIDNKYLGLNFLIYIYIICVLVYNCINIICIFR